MPKRVANELIKLQRKFLWNGNKEGRFIPLVSREIVQQPKGRGGLGVRDIAMKNAALLFKWWWRYACEEDSLWRRVIQSVHNEDQAALPSYSASKIPGPWQSIQGLLSEKQNISRTFLKHLNLTIENGTKTRFWEAQWLGDYSLQEKFPDLFKVSTQQTTLIATMGWFEGHMWKWALAWKRELVQVECQQAEEMVSSLEGHHPLLSQEDIVQWKVKRLYLAN